MKKKVRTILYLSISGLFLIVDQVLKHFARANPDFKYYLWENWLGWEYLGNQGIAFSIPFPNIWMLVLTPLVVIGLLIWYYKKKKKTGIFYFGFYLIIAGAISNYIDRAVFYITIDYFRVLTGVINLADVVIGIGVGLLVFDYFGFKKKK